MKWWQAASIILAITCLVTLAFLTVGKNEYVAVNLPGLKDGEVIQFECVRRAEESQQDFDMRVQEAGSFFRGAVEVALKDAAYEMADAIRNKNGSDAVKQLNNADQMLNDKLNQAARSLRTLYDCNFVTM
ncbi:hypothetical protein J3R80_12420 [Aliiroseovarius sp. Z3]|uniref:hypothetical protein n=1 Tax=Aliiroseovarius sp. Z3 TaxID=2811402 RepID=UPI0023B2AB70|nr:hypothetical protein [Aliiroseovarius sp. Z3]MDE9451271.1 hypothetical protein [Aliiroseovarius sp. Z3]